MKKFNKTLVLLLAVLILTLAACGGEEEKKDDPVISDTDGKRLSALVNDTISALGYAARFKPAFDQSNIDAGWRYEMTTAMFDLSTAASYGSGSETGSYYEVNGSVITFGYDYVRKENGLDKLAGDREVAAGKADISNNTVVCEIYTERSGKIISRKIIESVLFSDGSAVMQMLSASDAEGSAAEGIAVFISSEPEKFTALGGRFVKKTDFSFTSLIGRGSVTAEEMAAGFKLIWKITSDLKNASCENL